MTRDGPTTDWRARFALAAIAVIAITGANGAVAANLITGDEIKDESLTSQDVSGLKAKDFTKSARAKFGKPGPAGEQGPPGAPGP